MSDDKKFIGVIMTYQCADLLEEAFRNLPAGVFDSLIVIDDGSTDNVADVVLKLGLPFFTHEHLGYGGNLRYGLQKAMDMGGEYMLEIHGDGQFDQSGARAAMEKMRQDDLDFLIGSRFTDLRQPLKDGMPWPRYLANIGLSFIERVVLQIPWTEYHPGFRLYRRRFIEKLDLKKGANDYLYSFQIIAMAAYVKAKCGEVPVRANYHKAHTSVNYTRAAMNSFQETWVLLLYIMRQIGIKSNLFS